MQNRTVAHYRITERLGAGGMGEVWRATDTRLGRDVALKILPEAFAADPARMARFAREAQLLAQLNHPNIASIYGLEVEGGLRALVMELVEGPTLAERLSAGAMPLEEALPLARHIAEALEYAHERGIIHRDLKPANIKVKPDGAPEILDFGLAKAMADDPGAQDISNSPTLTVAATQAGVVLGTAAYMPPEQARGKSVDRRADIWSFGCVLYEMLTGRQAFAGETVSDILAQVITKEPDWTALPPSTPLGVRRLLKRCLEKDARRRLQAIGEARIALEDAIANPDAGAGMEATEGAAQPAGWRRALPWAVAAAALVALAAVWALWLAPPEPVPAHLQLMLPEEAEFGVTHISMRLVAVSPDGRQVVYAGRQGGRVMLFRRPLDSLEAAAIPGTEGGTSPMFSPDGRRLCFIGGNRLQVVGFDGVAPVDLAESEWSCAWGPDNKLYYTRAFSQGIWRVPATGGTPEMLTAPDKSKNELGHWWPEILPGGRTLLYTAWTPPVENARIVALDLATGEQKTVLEGGSNPRYAATGHLLFVRREGLMAAPFDSRSAELTGPAVRVLDGIFVDNIDGYAEFDVATGGTLVYIARKTMQRPRHLVWVTRDGREEPLGTPPAPYAEPALSPDGRRVALTLDEATRTVAVFDLARKTLSRVTEGPTSQFQPLWSHDGRFLVYAFERVFFNLHTRAADGTGPEETLLELDRDVLPQAFSPDGTRLLFAQSDKVSGSNIGVLPLTGDSRPTAAGPPEQLMEGPGVIVRPAISPDGRWVAYEIAAGGRTDVFVQSFTGSGARLQVSPNGGGSPAWARNGRELFYRASGDDGNWMMAVPVRTGARLELGQPVRLFRDTYGTSWAGRSYDVAADGRFLMVKPVREAAPREIVVVLNWFAELKRRVPR